MTLMPKSLPASTNSPDRRLVRSPHDDNEIRTRLRHHLRFEIATVHRLQVGHDGVVGKPRAQRFHRAQPFGEQQRRPCFEPVDAGGNTDGRCLNRLVERGQVQRELNNGVPQVAEIQVLSLSVFMSQS
jgi:hypothetical protein